MIEKEAPQLSGMAGETVQKAGSAGAANGAQVREPVLATDRDDGLYEIINGERVEKPPVSAYANRIAFVIAHHIEGWAAAQKRGRAVVEVIFRIDPATDLQRRPNAAFVSYDRWPEDRLPPHSDPWPVVPEVAAEVVSPTNPAELVLDKVAEYFRAGVQQVWFIYPRHQLVYVYGSPSQVRILTRTDELDGGTVLPGFRLPLANLFGVAPPVPVDRA
jgi:Uma2 family endonuclease